MNDYITSTVDGARGFAERHSDYQEETLHDHLWDDCNEEEEDELD